MFEINNNQKHLNFLRGSVIVVEGNIGVGKSTFGSSLSNYLLQCNIPSNFYPEQIDIDWLNLYLSDMSKYAMGYQMFSISTRIRTYDKALTQRGSGSVCIIDRSLDGDRAFAISLHNQEIISDKEFAVYEAYVNRHVKIVPDYLIYLKSTSNKCLIRTANRDRKGEENYSIGYFEQLETTYNNVIEDVNPRRHKLVLDWNNDLEVDKHGYISDDILEQVIQQMRDIV